MTPGESLRRKRERVPEIFARYDVSNPRLFGSVARGADDEKSDIDILVDPGRSLSYYDLAELEMELQRVLHCKADIATPAGLVVYVRKTAERELRPLF